VVDVRLPFGKVPLNILQKYVIGFQGYRSPDVVVGPSVGVDFAVVKVDRGYLIVSSDPVTGVEEDIGWYAVNVSANDVATSGAKPRFIDSVILLPEGSEASYAGCVAEQIDEAARELGISVVGGHTEVTPRLSKPIVVTAAFALAEGYVTSMDAREGDLIVMTKTAGVEGTSILARLFEERLREVDEEVLKRARGFMRQISVVKEASILYGTGVVHAMHDPTEGGILGGVYEMALASGLGFRVDLREIPVADETLKICSNLKIDPTRLIGSGSLIAAVDPMGVDEALGALRRGGVTGSVIGRFVKEGREAIRPDGSVEVVEEGLDELWRISTSSVF